MIALGSQFVMKSHKGEQLIEKDELIDSTVKTSTEVKLPEDMLPKNDGSGEKSKIGEKTWDVRIMLTMLLFFFGIDN
jgi:hypothetical protein